MKRKPKKCKGTGRARTFKGCGALSSYRKYGLCSECFKEWLWSTKEGNETIRKFSIKAKKKVEKEEKQETRKQKEANKSIAQLKQDARKVFQKWIRMRDIDDTCICCNESAELWDAGHYYKAEIYSGVIFDEINVNKQRKFCNKHLHGNEGNYRIGLIKKYGEKAVLDLDKRAIETKGKKWSREELSEIKNKYSNKLKNLEL